MDWPEAMRRIAAGEDVQHVIDTKMAADNEDFRAWLLKEVGASALADHDARTRDIDSGRYGARMAWHSISPTQRRALLEVVDRDGRLTRVGRTYRHRDRNQPHVPIYAATVRNLCARELMAWDGGAFDPEGAALLTERGRFVVAIARETADA